MGDNNIKGTEEDREIELRGFDYKLFKKVKCGGLREVIDGYIYPKHIIQLWPGDWGYQIWG